MTLEPIVSLFRQQQASLGREVNPFVVPARELRRKWLAGNHFTRRVLAGEKLFLIGGEDELRGLAEERVAQEPQAQRRRNRRPARASQ